MDSFDKFYRDYVSKVNEASDVFARPLTFGEKVLFAHVYDKKDLSGRIERGASYMNFSPDRVAMQDATAQMALLQFLNAGKGNVAVPASVHCDHLIVAKDGIEKDLPSAKEVNGEIYSFLRDVSLKYGIDFWGPGEGIIHQIVLENYALPGGMMIGTDSHTPNAGGLGMAAIGVGGADAVDVLTAQPWELKVPKIVGVKLCGKLSGWASPKDVILTILEKLTVKGGTNKIFEYFGEGVTSLSATGRATICNMGAELGATFSIFPYDANTGEYLRKTARAAVADLCDSLSGYLRADDEVYLSPSSYYDEVVEINLREIEPHLNGPFTPDAGHGVSSMKEFLEGGEIPSEVSACLIGSCTNSSYEDLSRAASVLSQALGKNIPIRTQLLVNPGSEQILSVCEADGIMDVFRKAGAKVMTCACGACIGQWSRYSDSSQMTPNSIVTSFNRNFRSRADSNPKTYAFVASPEMVAAVAVSGRLDFNPGVDTVLDCEGKAVLLDPPAGKVFPEGSIITCPKVHDSLSKEERDEISIRISPDSKRLQILSPFPAWNGKDLTGLRLLIKTAGKCTTDHISQAGKWLRFRGHLENISGNLLMGATNCFNGEADKVKNVLTGEYGRVSDTAAYYKGRGESSIVVAEENYGEGSSREHAAMEPRFLGVKAVLVKSFARIHETNLKKQGMLALTFADSADYDKVREDDIIDIESLEDFRPGKPLTVVLRHSDGTIESILANHSYNDLQIEWFKAGSALNYLKNKELDK
ncbi:MAG: aconitate hydratase [Bacteroidales bacterium]|nr:aconitate hydratase [Bacteroidales bacterium]